MNSARNTAPTHWQSQPAETTFATDVELVYMMPHMHVRGKDMTYTLIYPDGKKEIVLSVPKYDFNWQLLYQPARPIRLPKGTKLHVDAHYDNSSANKSNPNPGRTVYLGRMTWEEMMAPFFGILIDKDTDPASVVKLGKYLKDGDGA